MWTPDADWVMKERPWYIQGIEADGEKTAGAGQKMSELSADLLGEVSKFKL
ncbi:MAG: hypothetical protein MRZ88_05915 [Firmicutes bacterium]|nr:hypothetical protein [Bacillota bacterium]